MMTVQDFCIRSHLPVGRFALVLLLAAGLGACGEGSDLTAEDYIGRSLEHRAAGDPQASIIELKNAAKAYPQNGQARLLLGQVYLEIFDPLAAEKELLRAGELGVARSSLVAPLAHAWMLQAEYEKIVSQMQFLGDVSPETRVELHGLQGEALRRLRRPEESEEAFGKALSLDQSSVAALIGLGRLALDRRDLTETKTYLARALELEPKNADALLLRGDLGFVEGRFADAVTAYQGALEVRPLDPFMRLALVRAQIANKEPGEAIGNLEPFLAANPRHLGGNYLRAVASYEMRDFAAARDHANRALNADPDYLRAILVAGVSSAALEELEQANRMLSRFVIEVPDYRPARKILAVVKAKLGETDSAVAALEGTDPESEWEARLYAAVGLMAARSGDLGTGVQYLEKAASRSSDDANIRANLGIVRIAAGDDSRGVADLEAATSEDPTNLQANLRLALAHLQNGEYDKALALARRIQEGYPTSSRGYNLEAVVLAAKSDRSGAEAMFRTALEVEPGDPTAAINVANFERRDGNLDDAATILLEAHKQHPANPNVMITLAAVEGARGRGAQQESWLKKAVEAHPEGAQARAALARIYLTTNRAEQALELIEPVTAQGTENVALLEIQGRALMALRRPDEAAERFGAIARLHPELVTPRFHGAEALFAAGKRDKALETLRTALELDPKHAPSRVLKGRYILGAEGAAAARTELEKMKADLPDDAAVAGFEGLVLLREERREEALGAFRRAFELGPGSMTVIQLAAVQENTGDIEGGVETLKGWIEAHPTDFRPRAAIARLYVSLDRLEDAAVHYGWLVEMAPDRVSLQNDYAWVLGKSGQSKKALVHAEKAYALAPDSAFVKDTLGMLLVENGRPEDALRYLREASADLPDNTAVALNLARALAQTGETEAARKKLQRLLAGDKIFTERDAAAALLNSLPEE